MGQTTLSESLRAVEAEIAAGRPDRAMGLCLELQSRYPRALAVQRVIGEIYLAQRKTREAIGALDRALSGNPEDARAYCARAIVQQIHGNSMAALEWYRRACDTNPDDQVLRSAYRELASHLGQPPYQPTRMGLARLYLRGDLFPHAIREFESLLAEQPDSLEAQVGLAETLWRAHRTQAAEERCRRILLNAPSCLKATLILAAIEYDAGRIEEAERLVRRAAELDPDQRMGRILFADPLAAGDRSLRLLLLGPEAQPAYDGRVGTGPLSQPGLQTMPGARFAQSQPLQSPVQAPPSTPHLPNLPTQRMTGISNSGDGQNGAAMRTGPLPGSITSGPAMPPSNGRSSALPPDFHSIFAETEYMLWGREEDRSGTNRANPAVPPGAFGAPAAPGSGILPPIVNNLDRARAEPQPPFTRPASFVPPVLRDQGFNMEETEARAAINWINWLQAQGARPQGASGQQTFGTGPLPPPPAAPTATPASQPLPSDGQALREAQGDWPRRTGMPASGTPTSGSLPTMPTGPLPPAEELRAMFAQLQPDTASSRVVEGAIVSSTPPIDERPTAELFPSGGGSANVDADALAAATRSSDELAASGSHRQDIWGEEPEEESGAALASWTSTETESSEAPGYDAAPSWSRSSADATSSAFADGSAHDLNDLYSLYDGGPGAEHDTLDGSSNHDQHDWHDESARASASGIHTSHEAAPVTLESLERGFSASGFQSFQLRPEETSTSEDEAEALEAMSRIQESYAASPESNSVRSGATSGIFSSDGGDTWEAGASAPPVPAHTPEVVDTLAPDDHAGRLDRARQRRSDGQIDDALTDYRHILRNAPDLLGDVVQDLEETMADAPDHPEIHRLLGDARIRQGDYLSALESYNRAVALTQAQGS